MMMNRFLRSLPIACALALGLGAPNVAEAKWVFAHNHPDLQWYSIETEHFVVHYPQSKKTAEEGNEHYLTGEWSARKSAKVAEEMWGPMCEEFNYYLKEKIHIVLLNQSDDLEGFTVPNFDWIEISADPGSFFYRQRGRMEWFSDVLVHEFAHVVSLKTNGVFSEATMGVLVGGLYNDGIHDTATGGEVIFADTDAVYWTEGGAEYWSDDSGWNWWTSSRDMNIRMTVLEGRQLTWDEWQTRAGKDGWNDSERYYQQGYNFALYLRQRFGHETYAKFAIEAGQGWRANWSTVLEEVTGVPGEQLYNDWLAYLTEKYNAQYDAVKAKGEVTGRPLETTFADWEYTDPEGRDKWNTSDYWLGKRNERVAREERETKRQEDGTWQFEARISDDGQYMGVNNRGRIVVAKTDESMYPNFNGGLTPSDTKKADEAGRLSTSYRADMGHAWDFVPGEEAIVAVGYEHQQKGGFENVTGLSFKNGDGYDWKQLVRWNFKSREDKKGGDTWETRERKTFAGNEFEFDGEYEPIPNTLRAVDPSVSPDGKKVAFFQYTDGTLNLGTINMDGSDKKMLTDFRDGTWMQTIDWSPDGKQLVFTIFRNYQQNLYTINADGTDLKPIMVDHWEEQDAHWGGDGNIYFAADPGGIFNCFRYEPKTGKITQLTNVISGAESPQLTPNGNLLYTHYTAYGWKTYGLAGVDFMNADATDLFITTYDEKQVEQELAVEEDLSEYAAVTTKYHWWGNGMNPYFIPMFRLENDTQTNFGLSFGGQMLMQDFVEEHGAFLYGMMGEDTIIMGQYFNQMWYPTLYALAYHYTVKYDQGYQLDDDENPETTDDISIAELKREQYANVGMVQLSYPWNAKFDLMPFGRGLEYGFSGTDDKGFLPYLREAEAGVFATFTNNPYYMYDPNEFVGRNIELTYNHAWTDVVYEPYGGRSVDDGELLDKYEYNKFEGRYTEMFSVPTLGGIPFLQKAHDANHVIQLDTQFGWIDRNVDFNDEFRAGGQHPYFWGDGTLRPNTQFAGYPSSSLSGETMLIANLAYRFPVVRHMNLRAGPLFMHGLHAQVGGTAGNMWSVRPPEDENLYYKGSFGERIAYDPADLHREVPFVDYSYKNSPVDAHNYLLYDASAELRLTSVIFNGMGWDSFFRVAYGFQEIRGIGDVNGDDIYDTSENALGDELSNETELPGPRFYVGLGTGW